MELDYEFMQEAFFEIWNGATVTLSLTAISLALAAPIAFYFALVRVHGRGAFNGLVSLYVSFVRGTPIILQILLIYSLLPSFLNILVKAAGLKINVFDLIDPFWYAVVVFTLNTIALLTEVFRSALNSVPRGQYEAGVSIGLSRFATYIHVIVPQVLVVALPAICNITVNLIKGTSLAFLMTVKDVMAIGKISASYGYNYIESYLDVFIVYIVLCSVIQVLYSLAEKRVGRYRPAYS